MIIHKQIFDESNPYFDFRDDGIVNKCFIETIIENLPNIMKSSDGVLTLNEIYKMLGFRRTYEGATSGIILVDFFEWKPIEYFPLTKGRFLIVFNMRKNIQEYFPKEYDHN